MKKSAVISLVVALAIILGGWYYLANRSSVPTAKEGAPALATSSDSVVGDYLVADNGMTLYSYSQDGAMQSNCYGECAVNWPPYAPAADGNTGVGGSAAGRLEVITRTDSSKQMTYNGVPLYFWKGDKQPGDTTGQGVGGVWFLVKP